MGVDAVKEGTIELTGAGIQNRSDAVALGEGISEVFGISGGDWRVLPIMLHSTLRLKSLKVLLSIGIPILWL